MRTLYFDVDKQVISKDPQCDYSNLVVGSEGYLELSFRFSKEWDGCVKVVQFLSMRGEEYTPKYLANGYSCPIPPEATSNRRFKFRILGKKEGYKITTNYMTISQKG